MATAMSKYRYLDGVIHIIFLVEKISTDKKYKAQKKNEIVNAICALLNSNGGKVEICCEETEGNLVSTTILDSLTRTIEQSSQSRLGAQITESVNIFEDKKSKVLKISVSEALSLVTIKYNLYRPTQKQVELLGNDNIPNVVKIMKRRFVDEPVQLRSHQKTFLKGQDCDFGENEVIQFKNLVSVQLKRVTLADRIINKSNKFSCYVSAFANHRGGHIYYGIDDDGIVHGEETEKKSQIEKKVENAIQKMIWPDTIGQPKREEHWEIFFEPVLDEDSNPIPSTFVIVIFIAPCFGGVFTEEPESYEMMKGKVERMSFTTWKEKLQPVGMSKRKLEVPSTVKRISLSPAAKKRCIEVHEVLTELINNGEWESFTRFARQIEGKYTKNIDVKLVVLSRRVMVNYRQGEIDKASILHNEFEECFQRSEEPSVFEVLFLYLKAAMARVSEETAASRGVLTDALTKAELIEPGLYTAAFYLVLASIYDPENDVKLSPDILCIKALEHLEYVYDAPVARADMYHNAYITLATYYLGYNLSGKLIKKDIDNESFKKAQASIMAVHKSAVCEGNSLTGYREIWFTFAQSMLYIRHSQLDTKRQNAMIKTALNYATKAENLAKDAGFVEIVRLAETLSRQLSSDGITKAGMIKQSNEGKQALLEQL